MSIVWSLLIFSGIVLFHELGHFLLAKRGGIEVIEFSLGMGPRIISHVWGGTRYSWKILPFGGSCMMKGEDMNDLSEGTFASKSVWTRISVIAAGPIFNFIMAYVLAVILLSQVGADLPVLLSVTEGYPAAEAGIQAGDTITAIDGKRMHLYRDVTNYVTFHQEKMRSGELIQVTYEHEGEAYSALLRPVDNGQGRYVFGMSGSSLNRVLLSPLETARYGTYEVGYWVDAVFQSLKMMLRGQVELSDISGPVGVVQTIDQTYEASRADGSYYIMLNMINIAILLSANLGVMNLLPLPALDGGRLLFLLIEAVRRKRINPNIEGRIHLVGLMALMAFMVIVMVSDIGKLL